MQRSPRTEQVNIRLSTDVKAAGEKAASEVNRTFSSLLETLLLEYLARGRRRGTRCPS
jgi:hypothetical protein